MSASKTIKMLSRLLCAALLLVPAIAFADYELNLKPGVTEISQMQYDLHMLVLWICVAAGVGVFGVMIYSIINHRKSKGAVAAQFHESTTVEVIWTVIPFVILVAIAVPATKGLLDYEDASNPDMNIKVTGIQWKWQYDYIDEKVDVKIKGKVVKKTVNFISVLDSKSEEARQKGSGIDVRTVPNYLLNVDNPMVVPVDKRVRLLITAKDVIHAWWVPAVGVKRDAIPGYINESWFHATEIGTYRGQCAELCGKDHGFMPIVLKVVSQDDYTKWIDKQKIITAGKYDEDTKTFSKSELMVRGKAIYDKTCSICHGKKGEGLGAFPAMAGSKIATGDKAEHINIVANGKPNTAMTAYKTQLSKAEIAAVITYERNAFGNDTGDIVQPTDIK